MPKTISETKAAENGFMVEYHDTIDQYNARLEQFTEAMRSGINEEVDGALEELLGFVIQSQPSEDKRQALATQLNSVVEQLQHAMSQGDDAAGEQVVAQVLQSLLPQEREVDSMGSSTPMTDLTSTFAHYGKTLAIFGLPNVAIVAGAAAVVAPMVGAVTNYVGSFFVGQAPGGQNLCSSDPVNCAQGWWRGPLDDVLGTLKRVVMYVDPNADSSVVQGQKICLYPDKVAAALDVQFAETGGVNCPKSFVSPTYRGVDTVLRLDLNNVDPESCASLEQKFMKMATDCENPGSDAVGWLQVLMYAGIATGVVASLIGLYLLTRCIHARCCREERREERAPLVVTTTAVYSPKV